MGGYHWTEIVLRPAPDLLFAFFAAVVPVVNLHFYLVFPRQNPIFRGHRRAVLAALYGIPAVFLAALWGSMYASHWLRLARRRGPDDHWPSAVDPRPGAGLHPGGGRSSSSSASVAWSTATARPAPAPRRNQVKWILLASLIASVLIGYLLWQAWNDPATLGRDSAAWPMFGVSLLYTIAYAFSITRYKLMQVEEIINRSVVYFAFSVHGRA